MTGIVSIPAWNDQCVLPPINDRQPTSVHRSPYLVSLADIISHFGVSKARLDVLHGFLRYRALLHQAGLIEGFQWLDGSFLEHIEKLESRPPNDIDVVTFFHLPDGRSQQDIARGFPDLFPSGREQMETLKAQYHVDAYVVHLNSRGDLLVERAAYWYSVWSHKRNYTWKGYVQVDLDPSADAAAMAVLTLLGDQEVSS
jgi:hypothetical protein